MAIDASAVIAQILPPLVASSLATLTWWSENELYGYVNEAANDLARGCVLLSGETTIFTVPGQAAYALPELFLAPLELESGGYVRYQVTAAGLDAIDPGWRSTQDSSHVRYCLDADGPGMIRLYPVSVDGSASARLLYRARLADASSVAPTMALPACLSELIWWGVLGSARAKEGKAAMPDVAQAARQVEAVLSTAARDIWGAD